MQKVTLFIATYTCICQIAAQNPILTSNEILIDGLIEKNITITLDNLKSYPTVQIDSIVILNHKGEKKSTLRGITGIPNQTFLKQVSIKVESPKLLSEYYFTFEATDSYKVVYSWNEIFNTKAGLDVYIILERDGQKIEELGDKIAVVSSSDLMTGRRYVKGLKRITVRRTE